MGRSTLDNTTTSKSTYSREYRCKCTYYSSYNGCYSSYVSWER
nr:MAG TPA: hypothetical protein [Caudoviricetes sp.]